MKFETLIAKRYLESASPSDYCAWALSVLANSNSTNLAILAGLSSDSEIDSCEVEDYFQRSLMELRLEIPSKLDSLRNYAKQVCLDIINSDISERVGLKILEKLYRPSEFDELLGIWALIDTEVYLIESGEDSSDTNIGLKNKTIAQLIRDNANQYLKLSSLELPNEFTTLYFCLDCKELDASDFTTIEKPCWPVWLFRFLYKRMPDRKQICSKCGSDNIESMVNFKGRELYLKHLEDQI